MIKTEDLNIIKRVGKKWYMTVLKNNKDNLGTLFTTLERF